MVYNLNSFHHREEQRRRRQRRIGATRERVCVCHLFFCLILAAGAREWGPWLGNVFFFSLSHLSGVETTFTVCVAGGVVNSIKCERRTNKNCVSLWKDVKNHHHIIIMKEKSINEEGDKKKYVKTKKNVACPKIWICWFRQFFVSLKRNSPNSQNKCNRRQRCHRDETKNATIWRV